MKRKKLAALMAAAAVATALFVGCGKREDTRQYIHSIGVIFTFDVGVVFDELFVYDGDMKQMGPDRIKNTRLETKVGSFGVTLDAGGDYSVLIRDRQGGGYKFEGVPLSNGDEAVITFYEKLTLAVYSRSGSVVEVEGAYIEPGDAPEHPYAALARKEPYGFFVQNDTALPIERITMREAADPDKGEVELYLEALEPGGEVKVGGRLYEDDLGITEWVLHIELSGGSGFTFERPFNPWETKSITLSGKENSFEMKEETEP